MMGIDIGILDYSSLQKRAAKLEWALEVTALSAGIRDLVITAPA